MADKEKAELLIRQPLATLTDVMGMAYLIGKI